ncbi:hypothetical protein MKW92_010180 [Papaver armeniacum]|nr:hypothetical protein MKW92_010180 [Papaver armeniacum]
MLTVCTDIVTGGKNKRLKVKGPVSMPTKTLHITTRKTPCGEAIHKRVIDLVNSSEVVKLIALITIEASSKWLFAESPFYACFSKFFSIIGLLL